MPADFLCGVGVVSGSILNARGDDAQWIDLQDIELMDVAELLAFAYKKDASDVHISSGLPR